MGACEAIMFHLDNDLKQKQGPLSAGRRLKDWEYTDLFEDTCANHFDGYGLQVAEGPHGYENTLTGPGLPDKEQGIQMGSKAWNKRLGEQCRRIVFEHVGEDEMYEEFNNLYQVDKSVPCLDKDVCKKYRYCKPPEEEDRIKAEWRAKNKEKQDWLDDESKRKEEQQEVKRKQKKLEKRKKKEEEKTANAEEAEKQAIEDEKKAKREKQEAEQEAKEEKTKDKPLEVQAFLSSLA